jgi:predicted transposase YbfD/YdcC
MKQCGGEKMTKQCRPLIEILAEIPDPRHCQGKRYALSSILAQACAALLCGYRSYGAIAEWGRNYGQTLQRALGFRDGHCPCASTLHAVLRQLECDLLETKLQAWAEGMLSAIPPPAGADEALALDGKTLRGSQRQGAPGSHLLSVLSHRLGLTVFQQAVDDKTNEIPVALEVLQGLFLEGRVVTVDALLTQRAVARTVLARGGDYVMLVKGNQPALAEDIRLVFEAGPWLTNTLSSAETLDSGHGRQERRRLTSSTALRGYSDWPGLQQVFRLERIVTCKKSGKHHQEIVYGVTSLSPAQADPARLLRLCRQHWHIENKSHWVRDVTFDEDRSQVRSGSIPQVMAALRNAVIGLMRWSGETNIAAAGRRFAAQPRSALALVGINMEN